ncbi:hypothetical protein X740_04835 [Mesorhizobium sp. LNHC221B00]|nr:hypothetical protein X743_32560 [Mesorhizobium sp. LNHC252B00]ESY82461.1 hypothetical protein X740_04835 [Mesorhizobium sp. LNHC221B00]ESY87161.1 hypothetical protein X741_32590 [Mesorhizobium sp. LNHC229A00]
MIVMLQNGCGPREAVAAMMVINGVASMRAFRQRSPPGIERMQGATQAQLHQVF